MQGSRGQSGPERWMDQGWKCHPITTIIIIVVIISIVIIIIINIINIAIIITNVIITQEVFH